MSMNSCLTTLFSQVAYSNAKASSLSAETEIFLMISIEKERKWVA